MDGHAEYRAPSKHQPIERGLVIIHPKTKTSKPRLGTFLRRRRTGAKLGLREVCRRAKIDPATLSRIEAGTQIPTMDTLMVMSKVLDVEFEKLARLTTHDTNLKKKGSLK